VVVERDRELASDYAVAAPGALFASDPGWALLIERSQAVFNDPDSAQKEAPAAGDSSFGEGFSNKFWAKPFYGRTTRKASGGSAGYNIKTLGLGLGYERLLGENLSAGLALTLSRPDYHSSGVKSEDRMLTVAAYGLAKLFGGLELGLAAGHAKADYSQKREVLGQLYASEYHGTALRAGATLSRPIVLNESLTLKPKLSYDYLFVKTGGYSENSAGPVSLKVDGFDQKLHFFGLGAELAWRSESGVTVRGSLGGTRLAGDRTSETAAVFQGDLVRPFLATGDALDKNVLNVGLGVSVPLGQSLSIKADYRGDFGKSTKGHSVDAALIFQF
jgi:outer membrane autotransporter protein